MSASRAHRAAIYALALAMLMTLLVPAATAAAPTKPSSMAATGDSITRAFNLCFFPFSDCPARSWSTGNNSTVNSHARRLGITGSAFNDAVSGARMSNLPTQMATVANRNVGYVTILMGGNDVCTDTESGMTTPGAYETSFRQAMDILKADDVQPLVYVLSIPNVKVLWEILKDNSSARSAWSSYGICQSLLANPLSDAQADIDRRERVKQRNMDLNQRLRAACATYVFCRFDGEGVFGTAFVPNDVSTRDYFHPSTAGQAKLASVSYDLGYWGTQSVNGPPTASFTHSCSGLTCTFTDTSTDATGIAGRSWNFDATSATGPTSTDASVTHTFPTAGTYTVRFWSIDTKGATSTTSVPVSVTADGGTQPTTGSVGGKVTDTSGNVIAGAAVSVTPGATTTSTGTDGSYLIDGLAPGEYTVTVTANGFEPASTATNVVAGTTATADFTLTPSPTAEPTTMWIDALTGAATRVNRNFWRADMSATVVTEADGTITSVVGATVTGVFSTGGQVSCTTDSAGTCWVSSGNLRNNVGETTFTVTRVVHDTLVYDEARPFPALSVQQPA